MERNKTPEFQDPNLLIDRRNKDVVTCKKCGCSWMEQVLVQQYSPHHMVILGQKVASQSDMGFFLLRCIKCAETYEPNVQIGARDSARKAYDLFLDQMEKPMDTSGGEKV